MTLPGMAAARALLLTLERDQNLKLRQEVLKPRVLTRSFDVCEI
jgi:hypothetical protein